MVRVLPDWYVGCPGDRSIAGFCARNGSATGPLSRASYFKMKQLGIGPRESVVLGRIQITPQAEADWQAARTVPRDTEERLRWEERAERRRQRAIKAVAASMRSPKHPMNRKAARGAAMTRPRRAARSNHRQRSAPP